MQRQVFVKIGDFVKFKGFLVEFLENRRSWEKQKPHRKSPEKWTFLSFAFYNAPSLHTVEKKTGERYRSWKTTAVAKYYGFEHHAFFSSTEVGRPQMWERVQVGFGSTGKKRKGPCTKQCAWRKHGSCDTRLAEACPPKLWNTVKYRVEEMRPKWPFWKHRAPKMRLVEAQS